MVLAEAVALFWTRSLRVLAFTSMTMTVTLFAGLASQCAMAQEAVGYTQWNDSPDPAAPFGGCSDGHAYDNKLNQIAGAGVPLEGTLAITVLSCVTYDGPGGPVKAACPAHSPYQVCVNVGNDGRGNAVYLGVVQLQESTSPNTDYTGCPTASKLRPKINLVLDAKLDPRVIDGIETLSCGPATTKQTGAVNRVACPSGPSPFAYCLRTTNDGFGNAVTVGVIGANGASDPYTLYGECGSQEQGVALGFNTRMSFVVTAGGSANTVVAIDQLYCKIQQIEPLKPVKAKCSAASEGFAPAYSRYDYCVWGTDSLGNAAGFGVRVASQSQE